MKGRFCWWDEKRESDSASPNTQENRCVFYLRLDQRRKQLTVELRNEQRHWRGPNANGKPVAANQSVHRFTTFNRAALNRSISCCVPIDTRTWVGHAGQLRPI